jgi:uncharacterized membrane protein HdeD (DUF308 family)
MTSYPRPNWYVFNRLSLMPAFGVVLLVGGIYKDTAWVAVFGLAVAVAGTWLTMRRLTGRISERSLAWVAVESAVLGIGIAVVFALHLSGAALVLVVAVPAILSESIATALTGVREAK